MVCNPDGVQLHLQAAQMEAERQNDMEEQERWRKRIFHYLDWLFRKDSNAGADFAGLQVPTPSM